MRIVSGTHKGRRINAPKNLGIRPTTDFAKVALFNILAYNFSLEGVSVLDLFSGSGAIAFEFASRGAGAITAVENDRARTEFIRKKAGEFGFTNIEVLRDDCFRFLKNCSNTFNIIFADPPYDLRGIEDIPALVFEKGLLAGNGWLIVEHSRGTDLSGLERFMEMRTYGAVNFSIFKSNKKP